jgi:site-specific recombinase XerD
MPKTQLDIEGLDTLLETLPDLERALTAKRRSKRTIQSYSEAVKLLDEFLRSKSRSRVLRDITEGDIESFIIDQLGKHKPSSAAVRYRSLHAVFSWLAKTGRVTTSPMANTSPPSAEVPMVDVIPADDMRALFKACSGKAFDDYRDAAILRLFYDSGARLSELVGINVGNVDLNAKSALILGKGDRHRVVPFGDVTARALRLYLRARDLHGLKDRPELWLGGRGKPLSQSGVAQMLRRRCSQAGLAALNPHKFRHSTAAYLKGQGYSESEMMSLFGWTSSQMVHRYGRSVAAEQALDAYRDRGAPGDKL